MASARVVCVRESETGADSIPTRRYIISLPVLIIGPLFSPTRAWSTGGFDSGHIDDDDRLSFMDAAGYKELLRTRSQY